MSRSPHGLSPKSSLSPKLQYKRMGVVYRVARSSMQGRWKEYWVFGGVHYDRVTGLIRSGSDHLNLIIMCSYGRDRVLFNELSSHSRFLSIINSSFFSPSILSLVLPIYTHQPSLLPQLQPNSILPQKNICLPRHRIMLRLSTVSEPGPSSKNVWVAVVNRTRVILVHFRLAWSVFNIIAHM